VNPNQSRRDRGAADVGTRIQSIADRGELAAPKCQHFEHVVVNQSNSPMLSGENQRSLVDDLRCERIGDPATTRRKERTR
jgi:hypothetical protein